MHPFFLIEGKVKKDEPCPKLGNNTFSVCWIGGVALYMRCVAAIHMEYRSGGSRSQRFQDPSYQKLLARSSNHHAHIVFPTHGHALGQCNLSQFTTTHVQLNMPPQSIRRPPFLEKEPIRSPPTLEDDTVTPATQSHPVPAPHPRD